MHRVQTSWEIFWRFLSLGCFCFGGPAAHLGYFHRYFVERLNWLDAQQYGKLVALSQFLPGPGSSQVGFAIGLQRAGLAGGIAAFIGFTLPSFCLMLGFFALSSQHNLDFLTLASGLKLLAVVVVSDAVLSMYKHYCQSHSSRIIAVLSACVLIFFSAIWLQILVLSLAALFGMLNHTHLKLSSVPRENLPSKQSLWLSLGLFFILFAISCWVVYFSTTDSSHLAHLAAQFYHSGSLVFGGGHVVLPLLQQNVGSALTSEQFLSGYAAAQAVPGPMFSFATFLGAQLVPLTPVIGAILATLALFLPGLLLVFALHQHWAHLSNIPRVAGATLAINAAVVGLLFSALVDPIIKQAVHQISDIVALLIGFVLLRWLKIPILLLITFYLAYAYLIR